MVRFFSSMRFAFWLLFALIIWFLAGAGLAVSRIGSSGVNAMGDSLILQWLQAEALSSPLVLAWFIILCIIAFLLGISFLFCSWTTLYRKMKVDGSAPSIVLFAIHLLFLMIMALHLAGMLTGFKYSRVSLQPGESFEFEDRYSLELVEVVYVDDPAVLKLPYKKMRDYQDGENFHLEKNRARLRFLENGEELALGEIRMLSPFRHGTIRVSLNYFHIP